MPIPVPAADPSTPRVNYVEALSPAQRARIPEWVELWTKIGLCTEPADRAEAEAAIRECYKLAGLDAPKRVVWVDSPLALALAGPTAALLLAHLEQPGVRQQLDAALEQEALFERYFMRISKALYGKINPFGVPNPVGGPEASQAGATMQAVHAAAQKAAQEAVVQTSETLTPDLRHVGRGVAGEALKQADRAIPASGPGGEALHAALNADLHNAPHKRISGSSFLNASLDAQRDADDGLAAQEATVDEPRGAAHQAVNAATRREELLGTLDRQSDQGQAHPAAIEPMLDAEIRTEMELHAASEAIVRALLAVLEAWAFGTAPEPTPADLVPPDLQAQRTRRSAGKAVKTDAFRGSARALDVVSGRDASVIAHQQLERPATRAEAPQRLALDRAVNEQLNTEVNTQLDEAAIDKKLEEGLEGYSIAQHMKQNEVYDVTEDSLRVARDLSQLIFVTLMRLTEAGLNALPAAPEPDAAIAASLQRDGDLLGAFLRGLTSTLQEGVYMQTHSTGSNGGADRLPRLDPPVHLQANRALSEGLKETAPALNGITSKAHWGQISGGMMDAGNAGNAASARAARGAISEQIERHGVGGPGGTLSMPDLALRTRQVNTAVLAAASRAVRAVLEPDWRGAQARADERVDLRIKEGMRLGFGPQPEVSNASGGEALPGGVSTGVNPAGREVRNAVAQAVKSLAVTRDRFGGHTAGGSSDQAHDEALQIRRAAPIGEDPADQAVAVSVNRLAGEITTGLESRKGSNTGANAIEGRSEAGTDAAQLAAHAAVAGTLHYLAQLLAGENLRLRGAVGHNGPLPEVRQAERATHDALGAPLSDSVNGELSHLNADAVNQTLDRAGLQSTAAAGRVGQALRAQDQDFVLELSRALNRIFRPLLEQSQASGIESSEHSSGVVVGEGLGDVHQEAADALFAPREQLVDAVARAVAESPETDGNAEAALNAGNAGGFYSSMKNARNEPAAIAERKVERPVRRQIGMPFHELRRAVEVLLDALLRDVVPGEFESAYRAADKLLTREKHATHTAEDPDLSDRLRAAFQTGWNTKSAVETLLAPLGSREQWANCIRNLWSRYLGGQFWVSWQAYESFFDCVCGLDHPKLAEARAYRRAQSSCCWWWPHKDFVVICDRPREIRFDAERRLHREDGPAIEFRDGWGVWMLEGIQVPAKAVLEPEQLTVHDCLAEENAEVRRVLIERMGPAKFLREANAKVLDVDAHGLNGTRALMGLTDETESVLRNPAIQIAARRASSEELQLSDRPRRDALQMRFLVCACPSTGRVYHMAVPAEVATCEEADQWLSGNLEGRQVGRT